MSVFTVKQGDTNPPYTRTLAFDDGSVPPFLGATIRFLMRPVAASVAVVDSTDVNVDTDSGDVTYNWTPADTGSVGVFYAEWHVTYANGQPQTFPTDGYDLIVVEPALTGLGIGATAPTAADWVEQVKTFLYGSANRPAMNRLTTAVTASATQWVMDFPLSGGGVTTIGQGTYLSVGTEQVYVWAATSDSVTVERGVNGTDAQPHEPGDIVEIAPRYPTSAIVAALNSDLDDLSSPTNGLYRIAALDYLFDNVTHGYDLAADMVDGQVFDIRWKIADQANNWLPIADFEVVRGMPTSAFPSGNMLRILATGSAGQPFRVRYRAQFVHIGDPEDTVAVTGLPFTCYDIPPLGAALRLMTGAEIVRNDPSTQGNPRRAAEVPAGAEINAVRLLVTQRQTRVAAEASRLNAQYPIKLSRH